MTQEDVEARLKASGVTYETSETAVTQQITYYMTGGYAHQDVSTDEYPVSLWFDLGDDNLYHVAGIEITLKDVTLDEVVSAFGAPSLIFQYTRQIPRPSTFEVSYLSQGLVFRITNDDTANVVATAYVLSEEAILNSYQYNTEFSGVYKDCDPTWQVCAVPTATLAPDMLPYSTSAADSAALHDLLINPDCELGCWLGISAGLSEEGMISILEANNISYEVRSMGGDTFAYRITGGYNNPFVAPGFRNSIIVWVSRGAETKPTNAVISVEMVLNNIPLSDLIAAFGMPTQRLDEGSYSGRVVFLVYEEQGLVFTVDYDRVISVDVLSDVTAYPQSYEPLDLCPTDLLTCPISTVTRTPGS
jgi:hypothetical protein